MAQQERKVGIYVRLSNEDARAGESVSIENQKLLLTKHVRENGWELIEIYVDDGFSGTNQNRPALQKMLRAAENGYINTVLIKDLSRLGRNYLEVGNLAEVFLPDHGCELISLNEKVDEMLVFRNWLNEQHSKDTSKKVRAVKKMCAQNGKYVGTYAPFGFMKDPKDKHRFLIDENAAPIVRKIFELRLEGKGYRAIALHLNDAGIVAPRDYWYQGRNGENPYRSNHRWCDATVKTILANEAYIGNMVQLKAGTVSYKNHKRISKPKDEWVRAEGTHEAVIDRETWEQAQKISEKRYQPKAQKDKAASIFSGLLVCSDCGFKMRIHNKNRTRTDGSKYRLTNFMCGNYARSGKTACTTHFITEDILSDLVLTQIREHAKMVECDEDSVIRNLLKLQNNETESSRAAFTSELKTNRNRVVVLEKLIEKLYEDRVAEKVPETVFVDWIQKYEKERIERLQTVKKLENRLQSIKDSTDGAAKWTRIIKDYTRLETLDQQTLLRLIDRIEVGDDATVDGGRKIREVRIFYNYVGDVDASRERTVDAHGQAV